MKTQSLVCLLLTTMVIATAASTARSESDPIEAARTANSPTHVDDDLDKRQVEPGRNRPGRKTVLHIGHHGSDRFPRINDQGCIFFADVIRIPAAFYFIGCHLQLNGSLGIVRRSVADPDDG